MRIGKSCWRSREVSHSSTSACRYRSSNASSPQRFGATGGYLNCKYGWFVARGVSRPYLFLRRMHLYWRGKLVLLNMQDPSILLEWVSENVSCHIVIRIPNVCIHACLGRLLQRLEHPQTSLQTSTQVIQTLSPAYPSSDVSNIYYEWGCSAILCIINVSVFAHALLIPMETRKYEEEQDGRWYMYIISESRPRKTSEYEDSKMDTEISRIP